MSSSSRSFTIENILGLDKDKVEAKGEATTRASCENSTASHQEVPSPEPCNQATFSCIPPPIPMHIMSSTPSQITSPTLTPLTTPSLVLWPYPIPLTTSPTTHASRRRKARTVFTDSQVEKLEESFRVKKYLSIPERLALAQLLGLREQQVKTWYQNRRTKWRRELEEQDRKEALEEEAQ